MNRPPCGRRPAAELGCSILSPLAAGDVPIRAETDNPLMYRIEKDSPYR